MCLGRRGTSSGAILRSPVAPSKSGGPPALQVDFRACDCVTQSVYVRLMRGSQNGTRCWIGYGWLLPSWYRTDGVWSSFLGNC